MTRKQMLWAQQHDWFVDARQGLSLEATDHDTIRDDHTNWEVIAVATSIKADGEVMRSVMVTDSFDKLAAWAGY